MIEIMELVIMKNKQAVTSSLQVAETFEKTHKDVLEAYDNLMKQGGGGIFRRPILGG